MRRNILLALVPFVTLATVTMAAPPSFTVNTLVDENDGIGVGGVSLREAIGAANFANGGVINFSVIGTISLTADLPTIHVSMTINGPGPTAQSLQITGNQTFRGLVIDTGGSVFVRDLSIMNCRAKGGNGGPSTASGAGGGAAGMGGAFFIMNGNVRFDRCTIDSNAAIGGDGGMKLIVGSTESAGGGGVGGDGLPGTGGVGGTGGGGGFLGGFGGVGGNPPMAGGEGGGGGGALMNIAMARGATGGFGGGGGGAGTTTNVALAGGVGGDGGFGGGGGGGGFSLVLSHGESGGTAGMFGGDGAPGAFRGGGGGAGLGGAGFLRNGTLTLFACEIGGNIAFGGQPKTPGAQAGQGKGGAIFASAGQILSSKCVFNSNLAVNASNTPIDNNDFLTMGSPAMTYPSVDRIIITQASPTNAASVQFRVEFTEPVLNVDMGDFAVTSTGNVNGAAVSNVTGSGAIYDVTVTTGVSQGAIGLQLVDNDTITGAAFGFPLGLVGQHNGDATSSQSYVVDTIAPTVASLLATVPSPTNGHVADFNLQYSEAVTTLSPAAVNVMTNGVTFSDVTVSPSALGFVIHVNGVNGEGTVQISVPAAATTDGLNNPSTASGLSPVVTFDHIAPTVTITPSLAGVTNQTAIDYLIVFSEPVTGFDDVNDITLSGPPLSNVVISATDSTHYKVAITSTQGDGDLKLTVNAGAAKDAAGNECPGATTPAITLDHSIPRVNSITPSKSELTDETQVDFTVEFSEPVTGFNDPADLNIVHDGTKSDGLSIEKTDATHYLIHITGISGDGKFILQVKADICQDGAGNTNSAGGESTAVKHTTTTEAPTTPEPTGPAPASPTPTACGVGACGAMGPSPMLLLFTLMGRKRIRRTLVNRRN